MKKKLYFVGAAFMVICLALTGCSSIGQQQVEQEVLEEIEALPTNVIEDEPQVEVVESEPKPSEETVPQTQPTSQDNQGTVDMDWATVTYTADGGTEITYTSGVPDDFVLSNGLTFKQYADAMSKYEPRFSTENFRRTFSCFYGGTDYYNQMKASLGNSAMEYDLMLLTSVSWEVYNHTGTLNKTVNYGHKIFYCTDFSQLGGAEGYFVWDETNLPGLTYLGYELSPNADLIEYNCTVFTDDTLAFWLTCMYMAYDGYGVANPWEQNTITNEQQPASQQQPTTTTQNSSGVSLASFGYKYLGSYASEAQTAIEAYYGSTIKSVEDKGYTSTEGAVITMENGKTCSYSGLDSNVMIYDEETYDTIWSQRLK